MDEEKKDEQPTAGELPESESSKDIDSEESSSDSEEEVEEKKEE